MVTAVQKRAEIVVIIEWILFTLGIIGVIIFTAVALIFYDPVATWSSKNLVEQQKQSGGQEVSESEIREGLKIVLIVVVVVVLIVSIINFLLIRVLSQGVHLRIRRKVNIWYIVNIIFFILGLLGFVVSIFQVVYGAIDILSFLVYLFALVYRGVTLWIVNNLLTELEGVVNGVVYSSGINDKV